MKKLDKSRYKIWFMNSRRAIKKLKQVYMFSPLKVSVYNLECEQAYDAIFSPLIIDCFNIVLCVRQRLTYLQSLTRQVFTLFIVQQWVIKWREFKQNLVANVVCWS